MDINNQVILDYKGVVCTIYRNDLTKILGSIFFLRRCLEDFYNLPDLNNEKNIDRKEFLVNDMSIKTDFFELSCCPLSGNEKIKEEELYIRFFNLSNLNVFDIKYEDSLEFITFLMNKFKSR